MTFSKNNQQLLPISHDALTAFENFVALETHKPIIHQLQQIKPGEQVYLYGESSSGCSHLAKATCMYHVGMQSIYLPISSLNGLDRSMLEGINQIDLVCVEDIDCLDNNKAQQVLLFDLINLCQSYQVALLITAHMKPDEMIGWLPDLKTRLQAMCNWQLPSLSDDQKANVLITWLKRQNMYVDDDVILYVFKNITRDLKESKALLSSFLKHCMKVKKTPNINSLRVFSG